MLKLLKLEPGKTTTRAVAYIERERANDASHNGEKVLAVGGDARARLATQLALHGQNISVPRRVVSHERGQPERSTWPHESVGHW